MKLAKQALTIAARMARKHGLEAHRIPGSDNALSIAGQRCEILPGRVIDDEPMPEKSIRLHPSWGERAAFLVFVVADGKSRRCYIMPATPEARAGAWRMPAREIERYWGAWNVIKRRRKWPQRNAAFGLARTANQARVRAGLAP
jgi:hypothetical protein